LKNPVVPYKLILINYKEEFHTLLKLQYFWVKKPTIEIYKLQTKYEIYKLTVVVVVIVVVENMLFDSPTFSTT
jgi:hypothetical protein